jgi:hypothetical protein
MQRKEPEGLLELQPQIEPARRAAPELVFLGVPEVWPSAQEGLLRHPRKPFLGLVVGSRFFTSFRVIQRHHLGRRLLYGLFLGLTKGTRSPKARFPRSLAFRTSRIPRVIGPK